MKILDVVFKMFVVFWWMIAVYGIKMVINDFQRNAATEVFLILAGVALSILAWGY